MGHHKKEEKKFDSAHWIGCPIEEHYLGNDRKREKQKRKIASAKDRSKYKKTDRDQQLKREAQNPQFDGSTYLRGRILSIVPEGILVESDEKNYTCILRGLLKKDKSLFKNLITVGDFVLFEETTPNEGLIVHVEPRKTILSRADNLSRRKQQLIAANIDQVIITASVVSPPLKPALLDRYIIAARKGGLEPLIMINKIDLLDDSSIEENLRLNERDLYEHLLEVYRHNGIEAIAVSTKTQQGLDALREFMKDKASVFSGQSGVGKSSLINAITGSDLRIGEVVERTQKGSHTTTTAQLLPLAFGGWCIDTPGIKSFGVWELKTEEIEKYFTEIHTIGRQCHFPNCTHIHEADCAVLAAVEEEKISVIRYQSYLALIESVSEQHLRR